MLCSFSVFPFGWKAVSDVIDFTDYLLHHFRNAWSGSLSAVKPGRSVVTGRKSAWTSPRTLEATFPHCSRPKKSRLMVTCFTFTSIPISTGEAAEEGRMTISPWTGPKAVPSRKGMQCAGQASAGVLIPFNLTVKLETFKGVPSTIFRITSSGSNFLVRRKSVTVVPSPFSGSGGNTSRGRFQWSSAFSHSTLSKVTFAAKSPFRVRTSKHSAGREAGKFPDAELSDAIPVIDGGFRMSHLLRRSDVRVLSHPSRSMPIPLSLISMSSSVIRISISVASAS